MVYLAPTPVGAFFGEKMKFLTIIVLVLLSAKSFANENYDQAVKAIELGYDAKCENALVYEPSSKSSDTLYVIKCTKNDSVATLPIIRLEFWIRKNGTISPVTYKQCRTLVVTESFWKKTARCR